MQKSGALTKQYYYPSFLWFPSDTVFFFFYTAASTIAKKKLNKYIDTASTYVDLSHDFWIIVEAKSLSRFGCYESALTLLQFELMEENGKELNNFQQSTCLLLFHLSMITCYNCFEKTIFLLSPVLKIQ